MGPIGTMGAIGAEERIRIIQVFDYEQYSRAESSMRRLCFYGF
jgi:hypothetical protein